MTHNDCLQSAGSILGALKLVGGTSVLVQLIRAEPPEPLLPVLIVNSEGLQVKKKYLTSNTKQYSYPVECVYIDKIDTPGETQLAHWADISDQILDAFPYKKISAYPDGTLGVKATPDDFATQSKAYRRAVGRIVLWFETYRGEA